MISEGIFTSSRKLRKPLPFFLPRKSEGQFGSSSIGGLVHPLGAPGPDDGTGQDLKCMATSVHSFLPKLRLEHGGHRGQSAAECMAA